jgi:U6 snRNA-associated Sm-like protein LSm8
LGLYVVRGDNVALVGLVDVTADKAIDFSTLRAAPLKPVVH